MHDDTVTGRCEFLLFKDVSHLKMSVYVYIYIFRGGSKFFQTAVYIYIYISTCILGRTYSVERSIHLIEEH